MQRHLVIPLFLFLVASPIAAQEEGASLDPAPFDTALFDAVLRAHVHDGLVDYPALRDDEAARRRLTQFLEQAATMPETEPLASWINVYNAMVLDLVLEHHPIDSVMDVPGFFTAFERPIAGRDRSLDDIEHRLIRPRFEDARVHFALNCAALSCPPLQSEAYVQSRLDEQLDAVTRAALRDPKHLRLTDGTLHASALFVWFRDDFERDAGSVHGWIRRFAEPELGEALSDATPIVEMEYDWTLASTENGPTGSRHEEDAR